MLVPADKLPAPGRASSLVPPTPVPAGRPDRNSAPRPPELSADEKARADKLMAQGERFLAQGNIALAREFFRRAADAGLAQAAVRLAATYDPAELGRLQVQGVVPDRAEARKWYERARELGAPEAEERLAKLGGS
jgi:TPR repeat protein